MSRFARRLQFSPKRVSGGSSGDPLAALIASAPPAGTSSAPSGPMVGTPSEFDYTRLATNEVWDHFDGTTLDNRLWQRDYINQGGTQVYQDANLFLDGSGHAVMEATRPAGTTIYSGRFTSRQRFAMKYGWCAASIKMPRSVGSVGRAWFPAFWLLLVDYNVSNYYAEFDIIEQFGNSTNYASHFYTNVAGNDLDNDVFSTDANLDYRTYWMLWEPDRIRVGVDDIQIGDWSSADMDPGVWNQHFQQPMYYIINFAAAPSWLPAPQASDFPAQMSVDWMWYKPLELL